MKLTGPISASAGLIDFLRKEEALGPGTVMIVGNGFHEARGKSDEERSRRFANTARRAFLSSIPKNRV
jgi:hypothetical protein